MSKLIHQLSHSNIVPVKEAILSLKTELVVESPHGPACQLEYSLSLSSVRHLMPDSQAAHHGPGAVEHR